MNKLDEMFLDFLVDIKFTIYSYDVHGTRWILNQYVRDNAIRLFTISNIAVLFGYITEQDRNRIHNMVLAACDRMLSELDAWAERKEE